MKPFTIPLLGITVGDPHISTLDNGRYTCHIRGLFIIAQTTDTARQVALINANSNASDDDLLYPEDLFSIQVRSQSIRPALFYVEQVYGDGSVFSSYAITTASTLFNISNADGKFGRTLDRSRCDVSSFSFKHSPLTTPFR